MVVLVCKDQTFALVETHALVLLGDACLKFICLLVQSISHREQVLEFCFLLHELLTHARDLSLYILAVLEIVHHSLVVALNEVHLLTIV